MNRSRLHSLLLLAVLIFAVAGCSSEKKHTTLVTLNGAGEFVLNQVMGASYDTRHILPGDFDGDGDTDLFLSNYGEQNRLLLNNGSGEFTDGTGLTGSVLTGLPAAQNLSTHADAADVDGDSDLDIVVANNGQNILLINDGSGRFSDGTDLNFNLSTGILAGLDDTRAVAFINVDLSQGDTDQDLVIINNGQNRLFLNDGHGEYLDGTDLTQTFTSGLPLDNDSGQSALILKILLK